uniref:Uncharacterized protein n=1 Tax=Bactrocera dorsalis TaxID=27457 RepID=A0A034VLD6_BACDO
MTATNTIKITTTATKLVRAFRANAILAATTTTMTTVMETTSSNITKRFNCFIRESEFIRMKLFMSIIIDIDKYIKHKVQRHQRLKKMKQKNKRANELVKS